MTPSRRLLLAGFALVALGVGAYGLRSGAPETSPTSVRAPVAAAADAARGPTLSGAARVEPVERGASGERDARGVAVEPTEATESWTVAGRVLTAEGEPVAGAHVRLLRPLRSETFTVASGLTLPGGAFALTDADDIFFNPLRTGDVLLAELEGHVYAWREVDAPAPSGRLDLGDLRLRGTTGSIAGRVLGPGDVPLSARVGVEREDEQGEEERAFSLALGGQPWLSTSAADGGRFATAPLPAGLYRLTVNVEGGWRCVQEHVAAGTQDLVLRAPLPAGEAVGRPFDLLLRVVYEPVSGSARAPAESPRFLQYGERLEAEPVAPPAAPPGGAEPTTWLVRGVVPGSRPLVVRPGTAAWGPAIVPAPAPAATARDVVLPRARALHGVVRLEGRGVPARIQWSAHLGPAGASAPDPRAEPPGTERLQDSLYTDGEGRFTAGGLPPGTVAVWVNPVHDDQWYATSVPAEQLSLPRPAFAWWGWRDVPLEPEREVVFEVEPVARAVLELRWPDGEPRPAEPPRLLAWRYVPEGNGSDVELGPAAWTGALLRVDLIRPSRAEPVDVVLRGPTVWALVSGVRARPEPYAVTLTACARIAGVVLDPAGGPAPAIRVGARWAGEGPSVGDRWRATERTDETGRFLLRPASPGPYVLEPSDYLERWIGLPGPALAGDEGGEVRLRMLARRWVVGRVEGSQARDLSEVRVRALFEGLEPLDAESVWCTSDGFFRLPAPADLPLTLRAEDADARSLGELAVPAHRPARDLRLRLLEPR